MRKYEKALLPNTEGFKFIAIYKDKTEKIQEVKKHSDGTYFIDNFKDVVKWKFIY
jgi:hypothetical protein